MLQFQSTDNSQTIKKAIKIALIVIVGLVLLSSFVRTIPAGFRGVVLQFGGTTGEIKEEGIAFKVPFVQKIIKVDVRKQKEETDASSASLDLQNVYAKIAVNFSLNPDYVASLYSTVGKNYKTVLIAPAIQESVKSAMSKYTAEQLITKRAQVREEIKSFLSEKLINDGIIVNEVNIVDFQFSEAFDTAIEAKVTAEQNALAAKNKLEQVRFEADQRVVEAEGKAKAMRIESEAISSNQKILELRAIERWDGVLPKVTGSSVPFVNVGL
jgi:regulator of protease activity HflC (stomatin/prohibitin superfamily)